MSLSEMKVSIQNTDPSRVCGGIFQMVFFYSSLLMPAVDIGSDIYQVVELWAVMAFYGHISLGIFCVPSIFVLVMVVTNFKDKFDSKKKMLLAGLYNIKYSEASEAS